MANVTYDILWREAMMELLDQLEAETPEDPMLAPKDLAEWSCIYIKYLQIFQKLEMAYHQMVHPQKRMDMKKALEACCGRILEVRHWLVKLNRGLDFVNLDDILVDLKLTPDVLEVTIPRYFREDRSKELEDREKFLAALVEKYSVSRGKDEAVIQQQPPFTEDEAIAMIQLNERGRQARAKARIMNSIKKQRQLEDRRSRMGIPLTQEDACLTMQKVGRGYLARKQLKKESNAELEFLKMRPTATDPRKDPNAKVLSVMKQRKEVQRENQAEYDEAIVLLKTKVKEQEGQDMRETIQDKVNAWFVENRDPLSGNYPDFPEKEDGGSKLILNPEPPEPPPLEGAEDPKAKKGKGKDDKKGKGKKGGKGKGKGDDNPEEAKEEVITSIFVPDIESSVQEYVVKWQDRDESTNFFQKYDGELVKDELRPIVFEEIRLQVDEEMRILLQNLKDMVEAERAAKTGKKKKGKKGKKKKGKKGKGKKGKKGKDPTADRSMESLYAELVSNGILQQCPNKHVLDYMGSFSFLGGILEKSNILPDPSMGQVRQAVAEYCILPLGSQYVNEKVPLMKSVLLYGMPKTGKTLLTHAVANLAGANLFNLSPRNTDGKYPGKAAALMVHMVFKVARTMAPSVIYIDEAEKVFVSDKKKKKEFQPYSEAFDRIKKLLLKEAKKMAPGDRVLIVGNSSMPQVCQKKDKKAFLNFWSKHLYVPAPDYASLRVLWPGLLLRHQGQLTYEFDLSTLCKITENYTSGAIDMVSRSIMTPRRKDIQKKKPLSVKELLQWLSKVSPVTADEDAVMRKWTNELPARAAILGPVGKKEKKEKKGKGKKGKK